MSQIPPMPSDPTQIQEWVRSLTTEQTLALALANDIVHGPGLGLGLGLANGAFIGFQPNPAIELPPAPESPSLLDLRVSLNDAEPAIWRRLHVRGDHSLADLHPFLQAAFGWFDMHLHRFIPGSDVGGAFFVNEGDEDEGIEGTPEHEVRLDQVLDAPGAVLTYEYNFGDGWTHAIVLDGFLDLDGDAPPVRCLDGAGECPPEDCGGVHRYNELAGWIRGGYRSEDLDEYDAENADDLRAWLPPDFDPNSFDLDEINRSLDLVVRGDSGLLTAGLALPEPLTELVDKLDTRGQFQLMAWLGAEEWERPILIDTVSASTVIRPWAAMLDQVADGITLTSAGYLPPNAVSAIFEELDLGEFWIGKGNREDLTPPVHELRVQVQQLGLLRKRKGRLLPTKDGRSLRTDPVALWWHIARSLPLGRDTVEQHAGWITLVATGAGERGAQLADNTRKMLHALGWRLSHGSALDGYNASAAADPTLRVLFPRTRWKASEHRPESGRLAALMARAAVLRPEGGTALRLPH